MLSIKTKSDVTMNPRYRTNPKRLVRTLAALSIFGGLALQASGALAATYYVDPSAGSDSNAGTSQTAAWKTIPGTRTVNNGGWLRNNWGGISSSNRLQPGDVVEIKAGTTMSSGIGGRLQVDGTFYSSGTSTAPIVIKVSPTWGAGNFTYNMSGMTNVAWGGMVAISQRDYIQIRGADASRRFVVANAPGSWGVALGGTSSTHQKGIQVAYMEISKSAQGGMDLSYSDDFTVSNVISHENGTLGIGLGGLNDQNSNNGMIVDSESYGNGPTDNGSGIQHGFGLYGATNVTYLRCKSHNNGRDGFDFGTVTNSHSSSGTVVDSMSYDNGEDGFGTNGGGSSNLSTYVNTVAYNNGQSGWNIYGGATASLYHVIAHNNGQNGGFAGNFMIYSEGSFATKATIKNSIGYKPKTYANVYSYNTGGLATTIVSSNNIWIPRSSDDETFAETPYGKAFSYKSPPSWVSSTDKVGLQYDPGFTAVSTTSFASNNYRLKSSTSSAYNAGGSLSGITWTDKDFDGVARVGSPDVGAYEYNSGVQMVAPGNLRLAQ